MDLLNSVTGGQGQQQQQGQEGQQQQGGGGGFLGGLTGGGGIGDKLNGMAGGGAQGEKNEDYLDKGVDFVQERFMGGGAQNNESAAEQAKVGYFINVADKQDEMISDAIRSKYKGMVGSDFPVADKQQGFGGMGGQQQ